MDLIPIRTTGHVVNIGERCAAHNAGVPPSAASAALRAAGLGQNAPCKKSPDRARNHESRGGTRKQDTGKTCIRPTLQLRCAGTCRAATAAAVCFRPFHRQIRPPRPHPRQAPRRATRQTQPGYGPRRRCRRRGQRPRVGGAGACFRLFANFFGGMPVHWWPCRLVFEKPFTLDTRRTC